MDCRLGHCPWRKCCYHAVNIDTSCLHFYTHAWGLVVRLRCGLNIDCLPIMHTYPLGIIYRNKGLTSTHHLGLFFRVTSLDLSNNTLRRVDGLAYLQQVATLILDGNQLPGFYDGTLRSLPALTHLSVRNNVIRSVRGLEGLRGLPALTALHLEGNPVCALPAMADFAKTHLPYLISS